LPVESNTISIIDQPQVLINTQGTGEIITGNGGQIIPSEPYSNSLPVIETTAGGSTIPSDNGSMPSGVNGGTSSSAHVDGASTGSNTTADTGTPSNTSTPSNVSTPTDTANANTASNGQLTGQVAQDANMSSNQFLNGSVDYWTTNSDPGNQP